MGHLGRDVTLDREVFITQVRNVSRLIEAEGDYVDRAVGDKFQKWVVKLASYQVGLSTRPDDERLANLSYHLEKSSSGVCAKMLDWYRGTATPWEWKKPY
ncbi:hypothetical protein C5C50_04150 [Rathayibacter sp. AY1D9]|nr:hypothetical protein C5C50_04150 [Rathayibacter sp. AY1D9]